jgi:hypothetical protein
MSQTKKFESVLEALLYLEKISKELPIYEILARGLTQLKNLMGDENMKNILEQNEYKAEVAIRLGNLNYCIENENPIPRHPEQPIKIGEEAKKLESEAKEIQNLAKKAGMDPNDIKRKTDELALKQRLLFLKRYFESLAGYKYNKISYGEAVGCLNELIELTSKS